MVAARSRHTFVFIDVVLPPCTAAKLSGKGLGLSAWFPRLYVQRGRGPFWQKVNEVDV